MSTLDKIALMQNRRDEIPNQELARTLAETKDTEGIHEIAVNLWNKNQNIQSDCLKVLYEIGYIDPGLITEYVGDFLKLLLNKNNRMVWGSMIAISTIAHLRAGEIDAQRPLILKIIEGGSVITVDNGVKILAVIASQLPVRSPEIFPYLLNHLETVLSKQVPQHAEKIMVAVNTTNKDAFIEVLEKRMPDLTGSQVSRVNKVIKEAKKR